MFWFKAIHFSYYCKFFRYFFIFKYSFKNYFKKVEKSSIGSTSTFEIPRSTTIPSDNNTHKVSIGIINLKPEFEYEAVPRKNAHAFIKAKVVNDSTYLILAGQANVFFDNNFVAKVN